MLHRSEKMVRNELIEAIANSELVEDATVTVDLVKMTRKLFSTASSGPLFNCFNENQQQQQQQPFTILVDSECCLDRLYGGYYSDWICGGQWNKTYHFLRTLIGNAINAQIRFIVAFNADCNPEKLHEWIDEQLENRNRGNKVFNLVNAKAIPPPKVWWLAPSCLKTVLRFALRSINVPMICTFDDHQLELANSVHNLKINGLMSDCSDFLLFSLPHYFSAKSLKLTLKGNIECKEYICSKVFASLNLSKDKMCVLSALLGNHILRRHEIHDIYDKNINPYLPKEPLTNDDDSSKHSRQLLSLIRVLSNFVRTLESPITNMDGLIAQLFDSKTDKRIPKMEKSILYYLRGTREFAAFANSKLSLKSQTAMPPPPPPPPVPPLPPSAQQQQQQIKTVHFDDQAIIGEKTVADNMFDAMADLNLGNSSDYESMPSSAKSTNSRSDTETVRSSSSSSQNATLLSIKKQYENYLKTYTKPKVCAEILKVLNERCRRGLMSPAIYNILVNGEHRLAYVLEEECHFEFPPIHSIYKPIRQMMYAILFDMNHLKFMASKNGAATAAAAGGATNAKNPDIRIKEWVWTINNQYEYPEIVRAVPLSWGVPTLKRLWLGTDTDDSNRRMKAFLWVLKAEEPLLFNPFYVPPQCLIIALVLRYLLSFSRPVFRKCEFEAVLVHCVSRELTNWEFVQELKLPKLSSRAIQLASVIMHGVETVVILNEACGAPVPWNNCVPWLFFDGKLLHFVLSKLSASVSSEAAAPHHNTVTVLCNNDMETILRVERMRKAICSGVHVNFCTTNVPFSSSSSASNSYGVPAINQNIIPPNYLPPLKLPSNRHLTRNTFSRGGQLQIAGVVVGSWGPNYSFSHSNRFPNTIHNYGFYKSLMGTQTLPMRKYHARERSQISSSLLPLSVPSHSMAATAAVTNGSASKSTKSKTRSCAAGNGSSTLLATANSATPTETTATKTKKKKKIKSKKSDVNQIAASANSPDDETVRPATDREGDDGENRSLSPVAVAAAVPFNKTVSITNTISTVIINKTESTFNTETDSNFKTDDNNTAEVQLQSQPAPQIKEHQHTIILKPVRIATTSSSSNISNSLSLPIATTISTTTTITTTTTTTNTTNHNNTISSNTVTSHNN